MYHDEDKFREKTAMKIMARLTKLRPTTKDEKVFDAEESVERADALIAELKKKK